MKHSLVSIIIPVYNAANFLNTCLDSVLQQSWPHLEIILVDDGSSDHSFEICRHYALRDPRIKLIHQPNSGVSAARNAGIDLASGTHITFVDADDWLEQHHIENLITTLQQTRSTCAICGYTIEYPHRSEPRQFSGPRLLSGAQAQEKIFSPDQFQGFLCNKMFDSQIIKSNHIYLCTNLTHFEDLVFCAEFFPKCQRVCVTPHTTYHYRQHALSSMHQYVPNLYSTPDTIAALEQATAFCVSTHAKHLCLARLQLEHAHILRQAILSHPKHRGIAPLLTTVRAGIKIVLSAPLNPKYKLKFLSTAFFPRAAARFWTSRELRWIK